jgi:nicotinamidase-related amidase
MARIQAPPRNFQLLSLITEEVEPVALVRMAWHDPASHCRCRRDAMYRFDARDRSFGVMYAAFDLASAFAETVLRDQPKHSADMILDYHELEARVVVELKGRMDSRPLRLLTPGQTHREFQEDIAMAWTTLDPHTDLIILDLQRGIVGLPLIHSVGDIIARARSLADAFRERGLPVVLVNVAGGAPGRTEQPRQAGSRPDGWTDLIPELGQQPADIVVTKRTWGAFTSTDLEMQLRLRGITQVVIAGVATGTGVESTARQAYEQGFNVTLAIDAMTDMRPEAHDYGAIPCAPEWPSPPG